MKLIPILCCLFLFSCNLDDLFGKSSSGGSNEKTYSVVDGLKTALENGIVHGVDRVKVDGGYLNNSMIKILLPEDVNNAFAQISEVESSVNNLTGGLINIDFLLSTFTDSISSFKALQSQMLTKFNSAAEYAAPASISIFKDAIFDMSFDDANSILNSSDTIAATNYLEAKTLSSLTTLYSPMVDSALNQVEAATLWKTFSTQYNSLRKQYSSLTDQYNSLVSLNPLSTTASYKPLQLDTLTTDLGSYVTGKALSGLFVVVGQEEAEIRSDPFAYVTDIGKDILEAIFGQLES